MSSGHSGQKARRDMQCNVRFFYFFFVTHLPVLLSGMSGGVVATDSCVKYITIAPRDKSPANTYGRMDGCMESHYLWRLVRRYRRYNA